MDAIQECKEKYLVARERLLQKTQVGNLHLCARGRAYRALSIIPQYQGKKEYQAVVNKFEELAAAADKLIMDYNEHGFAYAAFAEFGGQRAEVDLPACDCEGCKIYAN